MRRKNKIEKLLKRMLIAKTRNTEKINEISYNELINIMMNNNDITIIDVRSPQEFKEGKIRYAINIPLYNLKEQIRLEKLNKNNTIVLYCQYGERSKKAYNILKQNGFKNVFSLRGGLDSISN